MNAMLTEDWMAAGAIGVFIFMLFIFVLIGG